MPEDNRPHGRQKNVTGEGSGGYRRGEGLGTGPVGNRKGYSGRPGTSQSSGSDGTTRAGSSSGGGGKIIAIIVGLIIALVGGGTGLGSILGGGGDSGGTSSNQSAINLSSLTSLLSNFTSSNVSGGWDDSASVNNGSEVNTTVAKGARDKYTEIKGGGSDTVTVMMYLCGTDLESKNGMATKDLDEIMAATLSDKVNYIVYTGGCEQWKKHNISTSTNQIYKIENNKPKLLVSNDGKKSMTDPSTLTSFIKYCKTNYPANRYELILWDHGGGTTGGFGYDQLFKSSGSMSVANINKALTNAGVKFDFIGFDACLMATVENALMLTSHADYLIASEETEPGIGWYYTKWLTELSKNTSMPTTSIGRIIIDDFVTTCARQCSGSKTTLSLIDLSELQNTVPDSLNEFAKATTQLIKNDNYKVVSDARTSTREFAISSKRDLVDLVHFAKNLNTNEGNALADVILSAVKYNRTSAEMTNSYGLSIYFPYKDPSKVDTAVSQYNAIGMDSEYSECIKQFASYETAGQTASSGSTSLIGSLLGNFTSSGTQSSLDISSLLGSFLGSSEGKSAEYMQVLDTNAAASYIAANQFDASKLVWSIDGNKKVMSLTEDQWKLVSDLELNVFIDDGQGFIDLGFDMVDDFFDDQCRLKGEYDGTWLAVDGQIVAAYHTDTTYISKTNYRHNYRIPVLLNGDRAELLLVFDNEKPNGYIAGARYIYGSDNEETVAKDVTELQDGDKIDFLCDYYKYDGTYSDSYMFGEQYVVNGTPVISNVYIPRDMQTSAVYRFTDIYGQNYWTPEM